MWQASGSAMSIPVECYVTGTMYGHGSSTAFEHLYEFINYVEGLPPESDNVFEVSRDLSLLFSNFIYTQVGLLLLLFK